MSKKTINNGYGEWKKCMLGDEIELLYGKGLKKSERKKGGFPVYGSNGIVGFHNVYLVKAPGIIIGRKGSVGEVKYSTKNFYPIDTTYYVNIKKDNEILFFYYFLLTLQLNEMNSHSAVPGLNRNDVYSIDVLIPPLSEQKAIAEVLSSLDDKIDLLHRQNKTLEQMAETLFRQWFVEEAKEDWEKKRLEEILSISSSKRIFYKEYVASGVPFYRSKEIIELSKGGTTSTELFISDERFNEIDSKFGSPKEGDILLTSVGTLGISYKVKKDDKFYFKDGNLTWFSNFKILPSSIIFCWLNSSIGKEELENTSIGSTQAALTISGLRQITIAIPPKEIIVRLNTELVLIYKKLDFNQTQIRTLEKLRDTLLPKLMSGEVRVRFEDIKRKRI